MGQIDALNFMTDTRSTPWLAIALVLVVILPVLYVLSWGPAVGLHSTGRISEETLVTAYLPLLYLATYFEPLRQFMNWYVDFFIWPEDKTESSPTVPNGP
jgi:hypothetical protein